MLFVFIFKSLSIFFKLWMSFQQLRVFLTAICILVVDVAAVEVTYPKVRYGQAVSHEPALHHTALQAGQKLRKNLSKES